MDIIKELEKMQQQNLYPDLILDEINKERDILEKKAYIFKILAIAKDIEDYVSLKNFPLCNIGGFELNCYNENEDTHSITTLFYRTNDELISAGTMIREYPEIEQRFKEIFNNGSDNDLIVKSEYLNQDFVDGKWKNIPLIQGAGEKILKALLNHELKSILDYSKMQVALPEGNDGTSKKPKL